MHLAVARLLNAIMLTAVRVNQFPIVTINLFLWERKEIERYRPNRDKKNTVRGINSNRKKTLVIHPRYFMNMTSGQKLEFSHPPFQNFVPRGRNDWDASQIRTSEADIKAFFRKALFPHVSMNQGNIFLQYLLHLKRGGLPEWYLILKVWINLCTRSASTSAAKAMDIAIDITMESAGWTQGSTFVKFHNKPVLSKYKFSFCLLQKCRSHVPAQRVYPPITMVRLLQTCSKLIHLVGTLSHVISYSSKPMIRRTKIKFQLPGKFHLIFQLFYQILLVCFNIQRWLIRKCSSL